VIVFTGKLDCVCTVVWRVKRFRRVARFVDFAGWNGARLIRSLSFTLFLGAGIVEGGTPGIERREPDARSPIKRKKNF